MRNQSIVFIREGRLQRLRRGYVVTAVLSVLTTALCIAMLLVGHTIYPVSDVVRVLMGETVSGASFPVGTIRLPRMLAGLLAGIAFGIAGVTFQTMLRNPLANPNVIGITSGSSAAAVFCIILLQTSQTTVSIASTIAGLGTVLIFFVLSRGKSFSIGRLILVGIGIQAICNSIITYLLLIGQEQNLPAAVRWLSGSLNGAQMERLPPLLIAVTLLVPMIVFFSKQLGMLELGEQAATSLGVKTDQARLILMVGAVILVAIATATTGPIASVAFLAGPIAKRLVGGSFTSVIPAGLVGAALVLAADLIGQFAFHVRFPVGIITGIIGAPYFIYLLIRMNRRGDL